MHTPGEGPQFRILLRDFLSRIVDIELLSAEGDIRKLLGQFAATLAAFSFTFAATFAPRYATSPLPQARLAVLAWSDEEFLIATTMAIAGLFTVLAWNAALPSRVEVQVLGLLPVRIRTIFFSKIAALGAALGIGIAAINAFTGLCYPFISAHSSGIASHARSLGAYWLAMAAAGMFACCALLAVEGALSQLLSYRLFLRASGWAQLAAFFVVLGIYFVKPPFPVAAGFAQSASHGFRAWLPSYWFFGLFQKLNGSANPAFGLLAARALCGLAASVFLMAVTFALAYWRTIRRILEQPDIAPADRSRPAMRLVVFLAAKFLPKPAERAVVLFAVRTIARSRQHRLLLAAYCGIGMAIALVYAKDLRGVGWRQPGSPLLIASLALLCFAVIGLRATFTLPAALGANWIFRTATVQNAAACFTAVRKALYAVTAVPLWIAFSVFFLSVWPARAALVHSAVLLLTGTLLAEISLYRFCKFPFACSYLPGKSNLNVKFGIYALFFLLTGNIGVAIEFQAFHNRTALLWMLTTLLAAALWARRRTTRFAFAPDNYVQFEDGPASLFCALDLSYGAERAGNAPSSVAGINRRHLD